MRTIQEEKAPKRAFRVLVVEDNAMIAMLYEEVLAEMGHRVCAIETTESGAISAAAQLKPDLLIVDASLREGSGVKAVQTILSNRFIPYIFVCGEIGGIRGVMPGAIAVEKPFSTPDLARAIQRALDVPLEP
jgi:two-component system, response regulator PdtaR